MPREQRWFTGDDLTAGERMNFGGLVETIFQQRKPRPHFAAIDQELAHLQQHVFHLLAGCRVKRLGRANLPHADDHHLRDAALHRPTKTGVQLDAVEHQHAGRLVRELVHPHIAGGHLAHLHAFHAGADWHPHCRFGNAERLHHRPLPFRGGAIVRTHRRNDERFGAMLAQPVAGRFGHQGDIINPPAAGGDRHLALRHGNGQRIKLPAHLRGHVGERLGGQFLSHTLEKLRRHDDAYYTWQLRWGTRISADAADNRGFYAIKG